ncbi:MAG: acetylglutamate kinase [Candidatus Eisenbacteria bacterium]
MKHAEPMTQAKPVVVKLGGRALEAPGALAGFAAALAHLCRPTLVVHGGGAEVTRWCERLGIASRFHDGLRVTDPDTLEVAAAVLAGLANKRLVAKLRVMGIDAVGLAALDGGMLTVQRHTNADELGEVGEVVGADASLLQQLLGAGRTPVVASLACDATGRLLNVNADDAASALAAAINASDLVLLSDTPGLKLDGAVVTRLCAHELPSTIARPEVGGGMVPKLLAAQAALAGGVARVHITAWDNDDTLHRLLSGETHGTTLSQDSSASIASAIPIPTTPKAPHGQL